MTNGAFVVLEGGDGTGKSTQARLLAERFRETGRDVVTTFEPGATPLGAAIRGIVLGTADHLEPHAEALLIAADRAQHVAAVVRPALARGAVVVSDRFVPSSLAYQGRARGLGVDAIRQLNQWATGGLEPDIVIVLDADATEVAARRPLPLDRLEREGAEFHEAVRAAYVDLARELGWTVVAANGDIEAVAERVWKVAATAVGTPR